MTPPKKSSKKRHKKSYDEEADDDDDDDGVGHVRSPSGNNSSGNRNSSKASEFFRLYVLDWRTLAAVFVPAAFCLVFPVYWLLICPSVWAAYPDLHRPDVWIVAYWVFAAVVWAIFLIICFYRSRSTGVPPLSGCGSNTESTEDLWSEDHYLPDNYLPSPDYVVSAIQPRGASDGEDVEGRREMDETWDYDYDHSDNPKNGQAPGRFPFEEQYHSLGNLCVTKNPYRHEVGGRKFSAPVFTGIVRAGATGGARLRTPDGGSTEEEGEGGGGYFRGPFHRSGGARRKVLTRTRPRYLATGPPPMPRLPWPTEGRCTLRRQPGFRHPRHLRPVRYHRPLSGCYDDAGSVRSSSIASSAGGSTSDFEPWSESTPPMSRKNPSFPSPPTSSSSSLTRHVPPPPLRRLNLMSTRPTGTPPLLRRSAPPPFRVRRLTDEEAAAQSRRRLQDSMTDDELKSLHDVAAGKVERKDSLVSEAKFDSLLSSLQSLASELERDFQDDSGGANDESGARGGLQLRSPRRKNSQESATDGSSLSTNY